MLTVPPEARIVVTADGTGPARGRRSDSRRRWRRRSIGLSRATNQSDSFSRSAVSDGAKSILPRP